MRLTLAPRFDGGGSVVDIDLMLISTVDNLLAINWHIYMARLRLQNP